MLIRYHNAMRRVAPLLVAGVLLQTGGCMFDASAITSGVLTSIATSILSSFIFGAFNIAP